jgi:hypothetical protein
MEPVCLDVLEDAYVLSAGGHLLGRLAGGADALMARSRSDAALRPEDVERAIEKAEDWVMPLVKAGSGRALLVHDGRGLLRERLPGEAAFDLAAIELAFVRAFDAVAFQRPIARAFVADIVLVRELMHHGALVTARFTPAQEGNA